MSASPEGFFAQCARLLVRMCGDEHPRPTSSAVFETIAAMVESAPASVVELIKERSTLVRTAAVRIDQKFAAVDGRSLFESRQSPEVDFAVVLPDSMSSLRRTLQQFGVESHEPEHARRCVTSGVHRQILRELADLEGKNVEAFEVLAIAAERNGDFERRTSRHAITTLDRNDVRLQLSRALREFGVAGLRGAAVVPLLTPQQHRILAALDGKNMQSQELADLLCGGDTSRLYKPPFALKAELMACGRVLHQPSVGYFRPDAPPPELVAPSPV